LDCKYIINKFYEEEIYIITFYILLCSSQS